MRVNTVFFTVSILYFCYNTFTVTFTVKIMGRKEGVFSFTVYCGEDYLKKLKKEAKGKKISAFVLGILDQHFGDTVTDTVSSTVLTDILTRLELIENTVFNKVTDTVTDTVESEATAPANFTSALLQRAKEVAPINLTQVSTAQEIAA
jgi:hypothetical protein